MQPLPLVRTADVAAQPWRNGGGFTRELFAAPAGPDWRVRVSVADVDDDGPFSSFPGVARWFAVLSGNGVVLDVDGAEHRCRADGEALAFDGGARAACRLIDGPTRDLNLMLRGVRGAMQRVVARAPWRPGASACGLYATSTGRAAADGETSAEAIPAHALRWWPSAPETIAFDGAGWWLAADAMGESR